MTEIEFDKLISSSIELYGIDYINEDKVDYTSHDFSPEFEKRTRQLIKKVQKIRRISYKRLITAIIAALIAATFAATSVSAVRDFFMEIFSNHTDIHSVTDDDSTLECIGKYEITSVPDDLKIIDFSEDVFERSYIYKNEHCYITFKQILNEYYDVAVNTEGYEIEPICINGFDGFYVDMYNQGGKYIAWNNDDCVMTISVIYDNECMFSKDELIHLAESIKKVE